MYLWDLPATDPFLVPAYSPVNSSPRDTGELWQWAKLQGLHSYENCRAVKAGRQRRRKVTVKNACVICAAAQAGEQ